MENAVLAYQHSLSKTNSAYALISHVILFKIINVLKIQKIDVLLV